MKIKKFVSNTLKEALTTIKAELGDDAIILSTRSIEGSSKGKTYFEVVAGIDEVDAKESDNTNKNLSQDRKELPENDLLELRKKVQTEREIFEKTKKEVAKGKKQHVIIKHEDVKKENPELYSIPEIKKILLENEVKPAVVSHILKEVEKQTQIVKNIDVDAIVISTISSLITTESFEVEKKKKPKIVSLVGPTGVGKTTCVAKLSLISKILHKLDIGIISIDTFRLGAIDQIKVFSELSNIDLLVAYNEGEIPKLIRKFAKKDMVFVDTVGRSQANSAQLKEMADMLAKIKVDETLLVLNTVSSTRNLIDVCRKFLIFGYSGIIFSKIDESVLFGNILNVTNEMNIPIKFLTNGQVIPDDIIAADSEYIAKLIYKGKLLVYGHGLRILDFVEVKSPIESKKETPQIISVTSGKGGTGKSFVSLNLAYLLSKKSKVLLIDYNFNFSNIHALINHIPKLNIINYFDVKNNYSIGDLAFNYNQNLSIVFGNSGSHTANLNFNPVLDSVDEGLLNIFFKELKSLSGYDYIILDTGAGISKEIILALKYSDYNLVVANTEPTAVMDAYAMIKLLHANKVIFNNLIVFNKCLDENDFISASSNLNKALSHFMNINIPVVGYIEFSRDVLTAAREQILFVKKYNTNYVYRQLNSILEQIISRVFATSYPRTSKAAKIR